MSEILYIDACVRRERSRTRKLAVRFLEEYEQSHRSDRIHHLDLTRMELMPQTTEVLRERDRLWRAGRLGDPMFNLARQFAAADKLVIAAPFWDLGFPALLKIYLERISVNKITFGYGADGGLLGLCRAERLLYITTRGGDYSQPDTAPLEMGARYVEALCRMYGIGQFRLLCAEGLDDVRNDPARLMERAMERADALARIF